MTYMAKKYEFQPDKPYGSWLSKLHLPKITLPEVDWLAVILTLMALAALVMIWLCLGRNLSGWMSLLC